MFWEGEKRRAPGPTVPVQVLYGTQGFVQLRSTAHSLPSAKTWCLVREPEALTRHTRFDDNIHKMPSWGPADQYRDLPSAARNQTGTFQLTGSIRDGWPLDTQHFGDAVTHHEQPTRQPLLEAVRTVARYRHQDLLEYMVERTISIPD